MRTLEVRQQWLRIAPLPATQGQVSGNWFARIQCPDFEPVRLETADFRPPFPPSRLFLDAGVDGILRALVEPCENRVFDWLASDQIHHH